jgi:hypothetical protein
MERRPPVMPDVTGDCRSSTGIVCFVLFALLHWLPSAGTMSCARTRPRSGPQELYGPYMRVKIHDQSSTSAISKASTQRVTASPRSRAGCGSLRVAR